MSALAATIAIGCSTPAPPAPATTTDAAPVDAPSDTPAIDTGTEAAGDCACVAGHPNAVCPDGSPQPYLGQACDLTGSCFDLWAPCPTADAGPAPPPCSLHECGVPDAQAYVCAGGWIAGPLCGRDAKGFCGWTVTTCGDAGGE